MNEGRSRGYKDLPFFRQAEIIYDFTVEFVKKYIDYKSRTKDQMEQAARSGKQNIAEGYLQKSLESRIKLVGVARGSLEELLNDYLDFLRQRGLKLWEKDSSKAKAVRSLVYNRYNSYNDYKNYMALPEDSANAAICLINQTNALLDQKLRWLEEKFINEGGFRENLFKKRMERKRGFTLIELLVVIAVLGILSGGILIALNITGILGKASLTRSKQLAAQLERGLVISQVGKWSFEEQAFGTCSDGKDVCDTSGYGNNGVINWGDPIFVANDTLGGQAMSFDGNEDAVDVGDIPELDFDQENFTIAFWVYVNVVGGSQVIVEKGKSSALGGRGYRVWLGNGTMLANVGDGTGGGPQGLAQIDNFPLHSWHYTVWVFDRDGGNAIAYLDGQIIISDSNISERPGSWSNTEIFRIGARSVNSPINAFNGMLDEVQIYNEALTLSQIQKLYAKGVIKRAIAFR